MYQRIYLDHNATTPPDSDVVEAVNLHFQASYGNPSSIHHEGKNTKMLIEEARCHTAALLNCTAKRVFFTAGGSEANNLAIKGTAFSKWDKKGHIITTSIEHPAVLLTCRWLEKFGFDITCLGVNDKGMIHIDELKSSIRDTTCLITIMTANNETGAIQPIREIAAIARERGIVFHTDAVQAAGKIDLDVMESGVDMLSISAHKFYGPKGSGALYIKEGIEIEPLIHGGSHEGGMRAGTENLSGIIGLGKAAELAAKRLSDMNRVRELRDRLEQTLMSFVPGARLNGPILERLPNTLNIMLPGYRGESVVLAMDKLGVALSSGSACKSGSSNPSYALLAMGLTREEAHCSIRLSPGVSSTTEEVDDAIDLFKQLFTNKKEIIKFIPCR